MTAAEHVGVRRGGAARWRGAVRSGLRLLGHGLLVTVVVVAAAVMLGPLVGYQAVVVTTGSMRPAIEVGDAVVVRATGDAGVQVGSIIVFKGHAVLMITHRVVAVTESDGQRMYQTRGDANNTPDADLVPASAVYGTYVLRVPHVGHELTFITSRTGRLAVTAILMIVIAWETLLLRRTPRARRHHRR